MSPRPVHICRVAPEGYVHHRAFDEVVETLEYAARTLGYPVDVVWNALPQDGLNLVVGAHLLEPAVARAFTPATVVCNFEPIDLQTTFTDWSRLDAVRGATVWDYSVRNVEYIRALTGNVNVTHVPIGYAPGLSRIAPAGSQDIDVLFYGSLNDRRAHILDQLDARGLTVMRAFGVYGEERDALIARAKVVLNVHYYEARILELVRVSYLLANRKAVVAEYDERTELADDLKDGLRLGRYDELVESVVQLVSDDEARRSLEANGFATMTRRRAEAIIDVPLANAAARRHRG